MRLEGDVMNRTLIDSSWLLLTRAALADVFDSRDCGGLP